MNGYPLNLFGLNANRLLYGILIHRQLYIVIVSEANPVAPELRLFQQRRNPLLKILSYRLGDTVITARFDGLFTVHAHDRPGRPLQRL